jgi:hypothetical protein
MKLSEALKTNALLDPCFYDYVTTVQNTLLTRHKISENENTLQLNKSIQTSYLRGLTHIRAAHEFVNTLKDF